MYQNNNNYKQEKNTIIEISTNNGHIKNTVEEIHKQKPKKHTHRTDLDHMQCHKDVFKE